VASTNASKWRTSRESANCAFTAAQPRGPTGGFGDPPQPATTPAAAAPASSCLRVSPAIARLYAVRAMAVPDR
jgi:hypothetical protein